MSLLPPPCSPHNQIPNWFSYGYNDCIMWTVNSTLSWSVITAKFQNSIFFTSKCRPLHSAARGMADAPLPASTGCRCHKACCQSSDRIAISWWSWHATNTTDYLSSQCIRSQHLQHLCISDSTPISTHPSIHSVYKIDSHHASCILMKIFQRGNRWTCICSKEGEEREVTTSTSKYPMITA